MTSETTKWCHIAGRYNPFTLVLPTRHGILIAIIQCFFLCCNSGTTNQFSTKLVRAANYTFESRSWELLVYWINFCDCKLIKIVKTLLSAMRRFLLLQTMTKTFNFKFTLVQLTYKFMKFVLDLVLATLLVPDKKLFR